MTMRLLLELQTLVLLLLEVLTEFHVISLLQQDSMTPPQDQSAFQTGSDIAITLDLIRHHDFGLELVREVNRSRSFYSSNFLCFDHICALIYIIQPDHLISLLCFLIAEPSAAR